MNAVRALALPPLAALLLACGDASSSAALDDARADAREDDRAVAESLAAGDRREAIAWLGDPSTVLFEGGKAEALELARASLAAGAPAADVIGIEVVDGREVTAVLAITLPEAGAPRAAVFAVEADFRRRYQDDPTPDVGQKYLRVIFD